MASNYTPEYGLNQWSLEDSVIMEEFNTDNRNIEQALLELKAGLPKFQTGSITVTEQLKSGTPISYTFDFPPKAVLLIQGESTSRTLALGPTILLRDVTKMICSYDPANDANLDPEWMHITWDDNTVSWYVEGQGIPAATYHYFAIG